eukprot:6479393-Pyramimonas_sp.AAC.1
MTQCKSFFPRTLWLIDRAVVLRRGFSKTRDVPRAGGRNMRGCLYGPMNEDNLNGTSPAMPSGAVGLNFNSDLQIPHMFPVTETTHDSCVCDERCWETERPMDMVLAAQRAQNAAAGYAADHQCKRCAPSLNE